MGPTDVSPIHVLYPDSTEWKIRIIADGCQVRKRPGEGEEWLTGTYHDPRALQAQTPAISGG